MLFVKSSQVSPVAQTVRRLSVSEMSVKVHAMQTMISSEDIDLSVSIMGIVDHLASRDGYCHCRRRSRTYRTYFVAFNIRTG